MSQVCSYYKHIKIFKRYNMHIGSISLLPMCLDSTSSHVYKANACLLNIVYSLSFTYPDLRENC